MSVKVYNTPRLQAICSKISASAVADIGTDHAYIPINALLQNRCARAAASDIREGPLEIARANVKKYNLADKISLRLGAGLSQIESGEAEEIIIAGMGGMMIRDIIAEDMQKARSAQRLILQPMNAAAELRQFLFENGFRIFCEDIAVEGFKVYNIFVCEIGEQSADELELHIPRLLYENKNFHLFIEKKLREFNKIYKGIGAAKCISPENKKILEKYRYLADQAEKIKKSVR